MDGGTGSPFSASKVRKAGVSVMCMTRVRTLARAAGRSRGAFGDMQGRCVRRRRAGGSQSALGHLGHVHEHAFPYVPVHILKAKAIHEAEILIGVDVCLTPVCAGSIRDLVYGLLVVSRKRQHHLTLAARIDDRLFREGAPLCM